MAKSNWVRTLFRTLLYLALLATTGFFGWRFLTSVNSVVENTGGIEVGSIAVVEGRVERRFDRQTRWGTVAAAETLYNLDAVRTTGVSRTVLRLDYLTEAGELKQDELILGPDTYIVLDLLGASRNIVFEGGDLTATGEEGLTVTAGETVIAAVDGAVNLERQDGQETNVSVTDGEAIVTTAAGREVVNTERALTVNEETGFSTRVDVAVNPRLPTANALLLTYGRTRQVDFLWDQFADWSNPEVEVSTEAGFDGTVSEILRVSGSGSATLELPPDQWFWRVRDRVTGAAGPVMVFTVDSDRPPEPFSPAAATVIPFRGDSHKVSLQWRRAYYADAYTVELSRSEGFNSILLSAETSGGTTSIEVPSEGDWYWRVIPEYQRAVLDSSPAAPESSFTMERLTGHNAPQLIVPADGQGFSTLEIRSGNGIDFRWQSNPEMVDYRVEVAGDPDFGSVVALSDAPENFRKLLPAIDDGTYYWRVFATSRDGQPVPVSETRSLTVRPIIGSVELVDPSPGEVKEVDSYASHSFLWRSSIPGRARFRLERITDPVSDARSRIIESLVEGDSFTAPLPGDGSYAWNIQILDDSGRILVTSPEARFQVRSSFGPPVLTGPLPGSTVSFVGTTSVPLTWDPSPGADAYQVIFRAPDGTIIGRDDRVAGLEVEFNLPESVGAGEYTVELSSLRNNPPTGASARSGSATYRFRVGELVRYAAAVPTFPANGAFLNGLDVISNGLTLRWSQEPSLGRWTVELDNGRAARLYRTNQPFLQLDELQAGTYTWRISSSDGLGQDAPESITTRFTVGSVPEPGPPVVISPASGENRDMTGADRLVFDWQDSDDADLWDLVLYVSGSDEPILRRNGITESRFVLRNLRILDVGDYVLELRARRDYEDIGLNQTSRATRVPFTLSLSISGDAPDILTEELQYAD